MGEEGQWCQENISCVDDYYSDGEMNCSIPRLAPKVEMFLGPRSCFQSKEFFKLLVIFFPTNAAQTLTVDSSLLFLG